MEVAERDSQQSTSKSRIAGLIKASILSLGYGLLIEPAAWAAENYDSFNLSEVAPGVFLHTGRQLALDAIGHDDIANIGFIAGKKCVAVIDSGGSVRIGRALRAVVGKHTSLPICYVINTHVHVDHILGNVAFKNDKPSFVGNATLVDAVARSRDFFVEDYGIDLNQPPTADQIIGPDRLVERELVLDLGSRQLRLRAWPTAHTDCDLTVFDEQTATMWAGDLLFRERLPAVDGSVKGWLSVIEQLASVKVKLVVPGHGPVTRDLATALIPERRYLQALVDGVRDELAQGKPVEDAIEHVASAEKSHWLLWESVHPRNVSRVYEELAWE
jgi:quinoprotein relay system zinc metallohydrolase 2